MTREEAIDIVRKNYPHVGVSGSQFETALRNLIPELRESEDEAIRKSIVATIEQCPDDFLNPKNRDRMLDWLKSLRPQSAQDKFDEAMHVADKFEEGYEAGVYDTKAKSWKPSEEHLSALLAVFNDPNNIGSQTCQLALADLYEQLKKLI